MANNNNSNSNNTRIQHHITAKLYKLKMIVIIGWPLGASVYDTTKTKMTPTTETKRLQHALTAFCTVCRNTVGRLFAPRLPGLAKRYKLKMIVINGWPLSASVYDTTKTKMSPTANKEASACFDSFLHGVQKYCRPLSCPSLAGVRFWMIFNKFWYHFWGPGWPGIDFHWAVNCMSHQCCQFHCCNCSDSTKSKSTNGRHKYSTTCDETHVQIGMELLDQLLLDGRPVWRHLAEHVLHVIVDNLDVLAAMSLVVSKARTRSKFQKQLLEAMEMTRRGTLSPKVNTAWSVSRMSHLHFSLLTRALPRTASPNCERTQKAVLHQSSCVPSTMLEINIDVT